MENEGTEAPNRGEGVRGDSGMSPGDSHPRVEVALGSRGHLGVTGTSAQTRLDEPLYAVNLLDRRRPWAYELYGALAVRPLQRAGGRVLFKGHRSRMLAGDTSNSRETLLLVRYPNAGAFLGLAQRPYFMALSVLRKLGLEKFLFGFARRLGSGPEPLAAPRLYRGDSRYLLWTFTAETSASDRGQLQQALERLPEALGGDGVRVFFAGLKTATVTLRSPDSNSSRPSAIAPPLPWDAVVLLSAEDEPALETAFATPPLAKLRSLAGSSIATFYRRTV